MNGKCLSKAIVYKATVKTDNAQVYYVGITGGTFKERYGNHKKSFKHEKYSKDTELSKHIWDLKKRGTQYEITWEIMRQSNTNNRKSGICNLCLEERFEILKCEKPLNQRNEMIAKCRHSNSNKVSKPSRVKKK